MAQHLPDYESVEPLTKAAPVVARRFTRTDKIVALLALAALASPFVARYVGGSAETQQVAQLGEVSTVRPIDIALGYKEAKAEAAFFEGLGQPQSIMAGSAEAALDLALAQDEWSNLDPVAAVIEPLTPVTEVPAPLGTAADGTGLGDIWSNPQNVTNQVAQPIVTQAPEPPRVQATAPPDMTPIPATHPKRKSKTNISSQRVTLRMDTPGQPVVITQQALPPLATPAPRRVAMATGLSPSIISSDVVNPRSQPQLHSGSSPRIALVITAAGLNESITKSAIESLPAGISLAFAPVKKEAKALAAQAKRDGHTVLVEVPMEPVNKGRDPGPMTLRVADSTADNIARLNQALNRIPAASGASSYLGARFNAAEGSVGPIVQSLAKRGIFLFENQPTERSVLQRLSAQSNLPYARGTFVIDRSKSSTDIRSALDALEKRAREKGVAIGVGSALRETVSTVALWAKEAQKRGVVFVPITEIRK